MLAPYFFEDFLYYMEKDRAPDKRFYMPRRRTLKVVVDDLQDLEDGKLDFMGYPCPSCWQVYNMHFLHGVDYGKASQ